MVQTITISKDAYSVAIYPTSVNTQLDNKLFVITPPQPEGSQDEGVKTPKIIDLLIESDIICFILSSNVPHVNPLIYVLNLSIDSERYPYFS